MQRFILSLILVLVLVFSPLTAQAFGPFFGGPFARLAQARANRFQAQANLVNAINARNAQRRIVVVQQARVIRIVQPVQRVRVVQQFQVVPVQVVPVQACSQFFIGH
jgi:hypothetical protein